MKLTMKERFDLLLDPDSFIPLEVNIQSSYVSGTAKIHGREIVLLATNNQSPKKGKPTDDVLYLYKTLELVHAKKTPLVILFDSNEEGEKIRPAFPTDSGRLMVSPLGMGSVYNMLGKLDGKVLRICMVFGKASTRMSFFCGLSDLVVMREDAGACIGTPNIVKSLTHVDVDFATLAGAKIHATETGMADTYFKEDTDIIHWVRKAVSYLPINGARPLATTQPLPPAHYQGDPELIIPSSPHFSFDTRLIIQQIVDENSLFQVKEQYAPEVITGFAHVEGVSLGIVANQSQSARGGLLFPESCNKISSFVELCSNMAIPVCFLVDCPGFMVGTEVEHRGSILAASHLFTAISNSKSPRMVVVLRRAYSAGLYAMGGSGFDPTVFIGLKNSAMAPYGAGAIESFKNATDLSPGELAAATLMYEYATTPDRYVTEYMLDEIVPVAQLRSKTVQFLSSVSP